MLGMTGSFGGFMPGSMGGGSPFGSMQVGHQNNNIQEQNQILNLQSCDITFIYTEHLFIFFFTFQYELRQ